MAYKDGGGGGPKFNLEEMQKLPSSLMDCFINLKHYNCNGIIICVC